MKAKKMSQKVPPRVTDFNPAVPAKLADAVHRCLAPDPPLDKTGLSAGM